MVDSEVENTASAQAICSDEVPSGTDELASDLASELANLVTHPAADPDPTHPPADPAADPDPTHPPADPAATNKETINIVIKAIFLLMICLSIYYSINLIWATGEFIYSLV